MSRKVIQAYLDEIEQLLLNCSKRMFEKLFVIHKRFLNPPKSPLKRGTLIPVPRFFKGG